MRDCWLLIVDCSNANPLYRTEWHFHLVLPQTTSCSRKCCEERDGSRLANNGQGMEAGRSAARGQERQAPQWLSGPGCPRRRPTSGPWRGRLGGVRTSPRWITPRRLTCRDVSPTQPRRVSIRQRCFVTTPPPTEKTPPFPSTIVPSFNCIALPPKARQTVPSSTGTPLSTHFSLLSLRCRQPTPCRTSAPLLLVTSR